MTILAVHAILAVTVASTGVSACTDGDTIHDADENTCVAMECDGNGNWKPEKFFNPKCYTCTVFNDPHIFTYGRSHKWYDFHHRSWYSIAQTGTSQNPGFALYGKFNDCYLNSYPSCVGEMVYKLDKENCISFSPTGTTNYGLTFNGMPITLGPPGTTTVLDLIGSSDLTLSWINTNGHLMIAKEKGFTIEFNGSRMWLRVPPLLKFQLIHGLCGTIFDHSEKLVFRNGDTLTFPTTQEKINEFGDSWELNPIPPDFKCPNGRSLLDTINVQDGGLPMTKSIPTETPCTTNETLLDPYKDLCASNIQADLPHDLAKALIDACAFDLCVLEMAKIRDPNGSYPEEEEWVEQAVNGANRQATIIKDTVEFEELCEGNLGFRGRCFGTQFNLVGYPRCDFLIENATGCENSETCCVDCSKQSDLCNDKWENSVARNIPDTKNKCCRNERRVGKVRPSSGCTCCIHCKPDPKPDQGERQDRQPCRGSYGRCITDDDPMHNRTWCAAQGGFVDETLCIGGGCSCCVFGAKK